MHEYLDRSMRNVPRYHEGLKKWYKDIDAQMKRKEEMKQKQTELPMMESDFDWENGRPKMNKDKLELKNENVSAIAMNTVDTRVNNTAFYEKELYIYRKMMILEMMINYFWGPKYSCKDGGWNPNIRPYR